MDANSNGTRCSIEGRHHGRSISDAGHLDRDIKPALRKPHNGKQQCAFWYCKSSVEFSLGAAMRDHFRTHTRPWGCEICPNTTFSTSNKFKKHIYAFRCVASVRPACCCGLDGLRLSSNVHDVCPRSSIGCHCCLHQQAPSTQQIDLESRDSSTMARSPREDRLYEPVERRFNNPYRVHRSVPVPMAMRAPAQFERRSTSQAPHTAPSRSARVRDDEEAGEAFGIKIHPGRQRRRACRARRQWRRAGQPQLC